MIKEKEKLFRKLLMVMDLSVVFAAFWLVFFFRQNIHAFYRLDLFPGRQVINDLSGAWNHVNMLPFMLFVWWASLASSGLYRSFRKKSLFEIEWGILKSVFFAMIVISIAVFIFKLSFISRSFMGLFFGASWLFLSAERIGITLFFRFFRKKGYNYRNVLLVGTGPRAENFIRLVSGHPEWGMRIAGLVDREKEMLDKEICGVRVIGLLEDIPRILHERVVDDVVFVVPRKWLPFIEDSLLACEKEGIKASIAADFFNMRIARSLSTDIEGIPLLEFNSVAAEEWQLLIKRIFDIIVSLVLIVLSLPLLAVLSVLIRFFSNGPAIFKQVRSGLNGRKFVMYKFRTMVDGAERKQEHLNGLNEMDGPVFKMRNDPRVTRFGAFLRRSSADELPQLFNVLKGEMSLVGPRPPLPSEIEKYEVWQRRRMSMKPGLTCLWQVNGRNNVDFDKWMRLDLEYIDTWSLGLDFKILLKTIPAVLFSIGAR